HERGHLLVAGLDEVGIAVRAVERAEERVDAVARVPVDAVDVPLAQAFQDVVSDELGHGSFLLGVALPSCGREARTGNARRLRMGLSGHPPARGTGPSERLMRLTANANVFR